MPETELGTATLRPTGDRLLTPALGNPEQNSYRIVLEGVFRCDHNGQEFDALYQTDGSGAFTQPHPYLQWTPQPPILESADAILHRYVFRVPKAWKLEGQSVGVRLDIDRFVDAFLISPSEVRSSLSGEMKLTVLQTPIVAPFPWATWLGASVPTALAVGGISVIIKRRMALRGLSYDLQSKLGSIEQKFRAARAVANKQRGNLPSLDEKLLAVKEGAVVLVRQAQELQNAAKRVDSRTLEFEIHALEKQMLALTDPATRQEAETALREKRKIISLLAELQEKEARCFLRLTKIEAILDTTYLTLRNTTPTNVATPAEETLRAELEAEVAAIREVEREISAYQPIQMQGFSH